MIAVAFFAAVAIICCTSAVNVTTSLLLPDGLMATDQPLQKLTFTGQVIVTKSTTYYILDCLAPGVEAYFAPVTSGCSDSSYTIAEISASTQYILEK